MRPVGLLLLALLAGCSDPPNGGGSRKVPDQVELRLIGFETATVVPGTVARVTGDGFLADAVFSAALVGQVRGRDIRVELPVERADDRALDVYFPPAVVEELPEGPLFAVLQVSMRLDGVAGEGRLTISTDIAHALTPRVTRVAPSVFPGSRVRVDGEGFIAGAEGRTVLEIAGRFVPDAGGERDLATGMAEAAPTVEGGDWARDAVTFTFEPELAGIEPGHLSIRLRPINEGQGWRVEGDWVDVEADLLPPAVLDLEASAASRGQAVRIFGQGFLGGDSGGTTILRLSGVFHADIGESRPLPGGGLELQPERLSGEALLFSMRVQYDFDCQSADLGANPGRLEGQVVPIISWQGSTVEGPAFPLDFRVLPTKQVVWLRFLPEFTDSLRLFGLRNVSGEVKARVVEVIRRDYDGINLEVREIEPSDFLEYAIVEIGGPDPNAQQLFGLDNTTGLDRCNQRLDDYLAGLNADSDSYGGIFVESFLQLSPSRGTDNPLAHPAFDEIFGPVIDRPVEPGEYPGGARDAVIARAIHTLGNLVGNTATHEIGHSLGLPVAPGCGEYHNAPGPRQIMDCGIDRPFEERAELQAGSHAVWTPENRAYLERILPLPR